MGGGNMADSDADQPSDTMRERVGESRVKLWLLLSFVLRIATVAKRTLSIGPFILRESARTEDIAWDE